MHLKGGEVTSFRLSHSPTLGTDSSLVHFEITMWHAARSISTSKNNFTLVVIHVH